MSKAEIDGNLAAYDTVEASQPVQALAALSATLPENGLDRMTPAKVESVLCTSALTAHI